MPWLYVAAARLPIAPPSQPVDQPEQRAVLADKVPDLVNIITGAMVIGFFVGEPRFSSGLLIAGIVFWGAALAFAVTIAEHK